MIARAQTAGANASEKPPVTVAMFVHLEAAKDHSEGEKALLDALESASGEMIAHYRGTDYKDPLVKQAALTRADRINYVSEHVDNRELNGRILDAYKKTPNIPLKNVVMGYLLDASKTPPVVRPPVTK